MGGVGRLPGQREGPFLDAPLGAGSPPLPSSSSALCQSMHHVMSLIHRWYLLAYLICSQVLRLWPHQTISFLCEIFFAGGFWHAAVGFADAMFEQWAWRKIIWSTATWRASPSGSISPRTRWVALCLAYGETKGCCRVCFVCVHARQQSEHMRVVTLVGKQAQ